MQTGMAIAALLFCLTSTVTTFANHEKAAPKVQQASAASAAKLMSVCHVNFTLDDRLELHDLTTHRIVAVLSRKNEWFLPMTQALNDAAAEPMRPVQLIRSVVLYKPTGEIDRQLYVTDAGLVFDPVTHCMFQTERIASKFLARSP